MMGVSSKRCGRAKLCAQLSSLPHRATAGIAAFSAMTMQAWPLGNLFGQKGAAKNSSAL